MNLFLCTIITCLTISFSYGQKTPLAITKTGDGAQPIILISGIANKSEIWDDTKETLQENATVYTVDYYKDEAGNLASIDGISTEIKNWITLQKINDPIIIGHSLGGHIALHIVSGMPGKIKKLIVIDAYPSISALSNPNFTSNPENNCSPVVQQFTSMTDEQFKGFMTTNIAQMTSDTQKQQKILDWVSGYKRSNYALLFCDYLNADLRDKTKLIECPTLILASSTMKPLDDAIKNQYRDLKNKKIAYSEKGLHFLMFDDFIWYINHIKSFIK